MDFGALMSIFIGVIFVNNFVLSRFLGLCPYIGVSRDTSSAFGMGMAVIFVMTMASAVTWFVYNHMLLPNDNNVLYLLFRNMIPGVTPEKFDLSYLETITFILVIAGLVQLVEMFISKFSPTLHRALGIYLPLITTNCAVLGVAQLNIAFSGQPFSLLKCVVQGAGAGVGFMLAMLLMSGIRERLELADVPPSLKGVPITFICAGLMSLAFFGFMGLKI